MTKTDPNAPAIAEAVQQAEDEARLEGYLSLEMPWPKGKKMECKTPGSGRKPGSKNKDTETIRIALMRSFEAVGGWKYLEEMARTQPTAYMTLLGKILPHELATSGGGLKHEVLLRWMTPEMARNRGFIEAPTKATGSD